MDEIHVAGTPGGFAFELRLDDGMRPEHRQTIKAAADRWARLLRGPVPGRHEVGGRTSQGPVVRVSASMINGKGGVLAKLGVEKEWGPSAGPLAGLPSVVEVVFDSKDLGPLAKKGRLEQVAMHELGHALGFGVSWIGRGLLVKDGAGGYVFMGTAAMAEYGKLLGTASRPVPVHRGTGTHGPHWHEARFGGELMNPTYDKGVHALSRLTLASLRDLGYDADVDAADAYALSKKP